MKINIEKLIKDHVKWCLKNKGDINARTLFSNLISELSKKADEIAVIQNAEFFNGFASRKDFPGWEKKLNGYKVKGLFELGHIDFQQVNPKTDTLRSISDEYILILFSKNKPNRIKICAVPRRSGFLGLAKSDLKEYYNDLEQFINTSKAAESIKQYVNEIPYKDFSYDQFDARVYTKKYLSRIKSIKKQKVVPLNELVDVIKIGLESGQDSSDAGLYKENPILNKIVKDLSENLDVNWNPEIYLSPSRIKKGDLILVNETSLYDFSARRRCYLVKDEPFQEQVDGFHSVVLRLKSDLVTPEYLYFYMQSEVFEVLSIAFCRTVCGVNLSQLKQIPVLLPNIKTPMAKNKDLSQKYQDFYKWIVDGLWSKTKLDFQSECKNTILNHYTTVPDNSSIKDYLKKYIDSKEQYVQYIENAYSDIASNSYAFNEDYYAFYKKLIQGDVGEDALSEELQKNYVEEPHKQGVLKYIDDVMDELKINIPNGAYQSAVVLMGAALEAFLVDWASEKDGKDYFDEPYRIVNIDGRPQPWYMSLNDAICRIGKVVKKWDARDKADSIRKMRNSIHPKVFLKQNEKLTKEKCDAALLDLDAVIKSRYVDFVASFFEKYSLM